MWTKKKPKKQGWYWWKPEDNSKKAQPVWIRYAKNRELKFLFPHVLHPNDKSFYYHMDVLLGDDRDYYACGFCECFMTLEEMKKGFWMPMTIPE